MADKTNNRILWVDNLKGVLILLVILGHCIQSLDEDFDNNLLFRIIYSFHMPLFMFLSGFVSYKKKYSGNSIVNRFIRLLVPFFLWGLIGMIVFNDFSFEWICEPDRALWFLYTLFFISCIFILSSKFSNRFNISEELSLLIILLVLYGLNMFFRPRFGFVLVVRYMPFYCMGALCKKNWEHLSRYISRYQLLIWICFGALALFWGRDSAPTCIATNNKILTFCYQMLTGTAGSLAFISLFNHFNMNFTILNRLGLMTLGIYAIHQLVIYSLVMCNAHLLGESENIGVRILAIFALTIIITLLIYKILSYGNTISKLLLGK